MTPSITTASPQQGASTTPAPAPAPAGNTNAPAPDALQASAKVALPAATVTPPKKTSVDLEAGIRKIQDIVERMNEEMKSNQRGLSFSFDRTINTHVVTVKSADSGEVIRQIPTETVIRVAHNIEKLKGLLFDGKN
jgi:flagellar protein FlaG